MHHGHDHHEHGQTLKRLGNRFGLFGLVQVASGIASGSSTTTMAGIHNLADWRVFHRRDSSAKDDSLHNHEQARKHRRRAAYLMLGTGLTLTAVEATINESTDSPPLPIEVLAVADIAINAGGLISLVKEKKRTRAHKDSIFHLAVDSLGAPATVIGVFGANIYPALDKVGALGHTVLLTAAAVHTLYTSRSSSTEICDDRGC